MMKIAIPAEIHRGEKRVATSPEVVGKLIAAGFEWMYEMVDGRLVLKHSGKLAGEVARGLWETGGAAARIGAGMYSTTSAGRFAGLAFSLVSKRLVVWAFVSSPRSSQP